MTGRLALLVTGALLLAPAPVRAHEGPPFPVVVEKPVGGYTVTVWADPDIGPADFFVGFDSPIAASERTPAVSLTVQPRSGRLPPAAVGAKRQRDDSYLARVQLDRGELWKVTLRVDGVRGGGTTVFEVEATPPGYGRWDLLIYGGPFLLLGALWIAAVARRRTLIAERQRPVAG